MSARTLLIVRGPWSTRTVALITGAVLVAFLAFVAGTIFTADARAAALGLPSPSTRRGLAAALGLYAAGTLTVGFLVTWLATHLDRISGTATFDEEGVTIEKVFSSVRRISWNELIAYDDAHTGYVHLERREPRSTDRQRLTVPTRDEESRRAVLDLLSSRGIARAC